jgi:hypothetical protein
MSEDPIGFAGGVNPYSYVGDSPVLWTDPFGLVSLNLFAPGTQQAALADTWNPKGVFTIAGHSESIWTVLDQRTAKARNERAHFLPSQLVDEMRKNGWTEGMPIELLVCQMGTGEGYFPNLRVVPYAQELANESRSEVFAPDKFVFWAPEAYRPFPWGIYGKGVTGQINPEDPGRLVRFVRK